MPLLGLQPLLRRRGMSCSQLGETEDRELIFPFSSTTNEELGLPARGQREGAAGDEGGWVHTVWLLVLVRGPIALKCLPCPALPCPVLIGTYLQEAELRARGLEAHGAAALIDGVVHKHSAGRSTSTCRGQANARREKRFENEEVCVLRNKSSSGPLVVVR